MTKCILCDKEQREDKNGHKGDFTVHCKDRRVHIACIVERLLALEVKVDEQDKN